MTVRDGRLVLPDGMSYRLLVLPESATMTPALLGKIKELVEAGATVVGPTADRVAQPERISEMRRGGQGARRCALGRLQRHDDQGAAAWGRAGSSGGSRRRSSSPIPACGPTSTSRANLRFIHRTIEDTDIYFVANPLPGACERRLLVPRDRQAARVLVARHGTHRTRDDVRRARTV